MTVARVNLWGRTIGAVSWDAESEFAYFEYDKEFIKSGIQIAPLAMPLSEEIYSFPTLGKETFKGLPGLLSDSLPDKFGNALIDEWLARHGRTIQSFNPVDRLCYVGNRGMGALEFHPAMKLGEKKSRKLDVGALVELASEILTHRSGLNASFSSEEREETMLDIVRVGTSAGGARAKAVIAWNPKANEVRSGQINAGEGFSNWLLKFDGVEGNKDKELEDPKGYGLIEYAYYKMALDAGIEMSSCEILEENNRSHFMTKRFDRTDDGKKIHMLSLCAMKHYDFNLAGAYSYEQAFQVIRELNLPMASIEQQYRRMTFNIIGRNQDDHVKNIAFLMDQSGGWSLSPAYDLTYSYNPKGAWTNQHQMTLNGKRDSFDIDDFLACADIISMSKRAALDVIEEVQKAISKWPEFAQCARVPDNTIQEIKQAHRKIIKGKL